MQKLQKSLHFLPLHLGDANIPSEGLHAFRGDTICFREDTSFLRYQFLGYQFFRGSTSFSEGVSLNPSSRHLIINDWFALSICKRL